jgi:hypothetical protein
MSFTISEINHLSGATKMVVPVPEGTNKDINGITMFNRLPTSMPDIDYDVSDSMLLKEKLVEMWGEDCVAPISNWNTLQLKSLIKDISKLYGIPFTEANTVTSIMIREATPEAKRAHGIKSGIYAPTWQEVIEFSPALRKYLDKYPQVKTHVEGLVGQVRSCFTETVGILTDTGYKTIKEIEEGDKVAYYSHTKEISYNSDYEIYFQGSKEVFEVELEDGSVLELTADHEVLTQDGYKKVSELTEVDYLVEVGL